eukprot:31010-Pelagococcus_subviridis.AAC.10
MRTLRPTNTLLARVVPTLVPRVDDTRTRPSSRSRSSRSTAPRTPGPGSAASRRTSSRTTRLSGPAPEVDAARGTPALLQVPALAQLHRGHDAVALARNNLARPDEPRERVDGDDRVHFVDPPPLRPDDFLEPRSHPRRDEPEERRQHDRALPRRRAPNGDQVRERDESIETALR